MYFGVFNWFDFEEELQFMCVMIMFCLEGSMSQYFFLFFRCVIFLIFIKRCVYMIEDLFKKYCCYYQIKIYLNM